MVGMTRAGGDGNSNDDDNLDEKGKNDESVGSGMLWARVFFYFYILISHPCLRTTYTHIYIIPIERQN